MLNVTPGELERTKDQPKPPEKTGKLNITHKNHCTDLSFLIIFNSIKSE